MAKTTKKKRPYSLEYTAKKGSTPRRYLLSGIPPGLWERFRARAKREGVAVRQVLLAHVEAWVDRPAEDVTPTPRRVRKSTPVPYTNSSDLSAMYPEAMADPVKP